MKRQFFNFVFEKDYYSYIIGKNILVERSKFRRKNQVLLGLLVFEVKSIRDRIVVKKGNECMKNLGMELRKFGSILYQI